MNVRQRERVLAYLSVKRIVQEALMQERRSLDLRREAVTLRAQNVAAAIIEELMPEGK